MSVRNIAGTQSCLFFRDRMQQCMEMQKGKAMDAKLKFNEPWIEQRADPYMMKAEDGSYYFTASVPTYDRIVLRRADSIRGLADAQEKTVWTMHGSGEMSKHIWAPEIHFLDGGWYIYYAGGCFPE